jgi:predicted GNAT family N-acyltransferase
LRQTRDIATCLALRRSVFIDEQGVSEADEIDDLDAVAVHLLAMLGGRPVGSARLLVQAIPARSAGSACCATSAAPGLGPR